MGFAIAYYSLLTLLIFVAVLLILLVLIQKGRGGGLSGAFGGGGGSTAFGAKTGDVLTWATSIIFGIFILLAVALDLVVDHQYTAAPIVNPGLISTSPIMGTTPAQSLPPQDAPPATGPTSASPTPIIPPSSVAPAVTQPASSMPSATTVPGLRVGVPTVPVLPPVKSMPTTTPANPIPGMVQKAATQVFMQAGQLSDSAKAATQPAGKTLNGGKP